MKSNIKAEVIKRKPLIIYFHGFIGNKTANALRHMGHETVSIQMIAVYKIKEISNKRQRIPKGQSRETGTQDEEKQSKNTTFNGYVLDTTICKQTQIT